jgi:hypothetical protein
VKVLDSGDETHRNSHEMASDESLLAISSHSTAAPAAAQVSAKSEALTLASAVLTTIHVSSFAQASPQADADANSVEKTVADEHASDSGDEDDEEELSPRPRFKTPAKTSTERRKKRRLAMTVELTNGALTARVPIETTGSKSLDSRVPTRFKHHKSKDAPSPSNWVHQLHPD